MPALDVSAVLLDPLFIDAAECVRRAEIVNEYGESCLTETRLPFYGVFTAKDGSFLQREEEAGRESEVITCHTKFPLAGAQAGKQPDVVIWAGAEYTVIRRYNWSRFGGGFVAVDLENRGLLEAGGIA